MAELLSGLHEALPLKADEHKDAGQHDTRRWAASCGWPPACSARYVASPLSRGQKLTTHHQLTRTRPPTALVVET